MSTTKATRRLTALLTIGILATALAPSARATLLVSYNYDEATSGTTAAINSGSLGAAANGVFSGPVTRVAGGPGPQSVAAANFTGDTGAVGPATHLSGLVPLSTMTVATWLDVQGTANRGFYGLVSDQNSTPSADGWLLYYTPIGLDATKVQLGFQVGTNAVDATSSVTSNNNWVFLAATWDKTSGVVNFYAGSPTSPMALISTAGGMTTAMTDSGLPMAVGAQSEHAPIAFMDDTRVYDNVLNLSQLEALRLADITPVPEPATALMALVPVVGLLVPYARRKLARRSS